MAKGAPRAPFACSVTGFNLERLFVAGGTKSGAAFGSVPVGFRYAGPACSDLAAGHLQGPAQTVTQRRTTSFPWSRY